MCISQDLSPHPSPAPSSFDVYVLRFRYRERRAGLVTPNLLRGAFGSALKKISEPDFEHYFAPRRLIRNLPSGLADPPRPFAFRLPEAGLLQMNVFTTRERVHGLFQLALEQIDALTIETAEEQFVQVPLGPPLQPVRRLRIHFRSPTELKPPGEPSFGILLSRIRDRVSTLRALWGRGPLEMDFHAFGLRAARVALTHRDLVDTERVRTSRRTGQTHSIGGFTGFAEYQGDLAEFVPYLEAARYTGIGRQTVWGKGEIAYETF